MALQRLLSQICLYNYQVLLQARHTLHHASDVSAGQQDFLLRYQRLSLMPDPHCRSSHHLLPEHG